MSARVVVVVVAAWLVACSSAPPVPAWQADARGSLDRAVAAYLTGDARVAGVEFDRARAAIGSTGRIDLLARAELVACAAQAASLVFEPCTRFEALRADAAPAERAYADYLAGQVAPDAVALLPPPQRAVAAKGATSALKDIDDPFSRLVAAAVLFRGGRGDPALIHLAIETASTQGWRRPLLAWLGVLRKRAEGAGDAAAVERVQRQIDLVQGAR